MKLLIIDNTEADDKQFNAALIESLDQIAPCDVVNYQQADENFIQKNKYAGVVLSGVPIFYSANIITERAARLEWLKYTSLPVLGICLGHQSMGKVFGASIRQGLEAESGPILIQTTAAGLTDPLLAQIPASVFETSAIHRCSITLPQNFIRLGSSDVCENQIIKHRAKPLYGVQFHPEHSAIGPTFFKSFANLAATANLLDPEMHALHIPNANLASSELKI
jgi:GMP synthase (glutamine-hydrolysing)